MVLFDISTPRAYAYQVMRSAKIDVEQIIRVSTPGPNEEEGAEIEVLYVTSDKQAFIAYVRSNGTVAGHGLPW